MHFRLGSRWPRQGAPVPRGLYRGAAKNGKSHGGRDRSGVHGRGRVHGAEVYSGATTEKQAWEVFRPARIMAKNTPQLCEHYGIEVNASNLLRLSGMRASSR